MLVESTMVSMQDTRPADLSPGQVRAEHPHLKSPSCWAVTGTEQCIQARWIPSQSFACKNTHFEFHRSQSCLPGTLGGTHSASGCSVLTWGSCLLISGHGLMDCSLQKPKLQVTEAQQGPRPRKKKKKKKVSTSKQSRSSCRNRKVPKTENSTIFKWQSPPVQTAEIDSASAI